MNTDVNLKYVHFFNMGEFQIKLQYCRSALFSFTAEQRLLRLLQFQRGNRIILLLRCTSCLQPRLRWFWTFLFISFLLSCHCILSLALALALVSWMTTTNAKWKKATTKQAGKKNVKDKMYFNSCFQLFKLLPPRTTRGNSHFEKSGHRQSNTCGMITFAL